MIERIKTLLVVAAHPDDEVLGCGGTLAKLVKEGASIHVAFMADGVTSRTELSDQSINELKIRRQAAIKACKVLGVDSVTFDDYEDNQLDKVAQLELTKKIEILIHKLRPDTILTHHVGDVNIDHQKVHYAVIPACRPQPGNPVKTILCFETLSSTEWQLPGSASPFIPNIFIDISAHIDKKLEALNAYAKELKDWPHPRSGKGVETLAKYRGMTICVEAAEAFMLTRFIT